MQDLFTAFGIDWRLIVIQIFNFAILAGALFYFLYTPILKILSDRESKIQKGVEDANAASESRLRAEEEKKVVLQNATKEAEGMIERAESHAEEKASAILAHAKKQADATLEATKLRAEEMKREAERESEAEIAKIAVLAAEKMIREKLEA